MKTTNPATLQTQLETALPGRDDFASVQSHPELFRAIFDELAEQIEAGVATDSPLNPTPPPVSTPR